ncbi:MAG: exopolysaccharide biosynthesis polyprenyl glycosylphosphotransferase [Lachnospiraceae bacterium]|nr:exopolysaccharide biosynthesis polyprenyl glycosylphosphotransferase [Lachnospiraceae bacterium]
MKRLESLKRIGVLWLSFIGVLMQAAVYTYIWMHCYYPIINNFNRGLKFTKNGHILVILIYVVLLVFFNNTYGGTKIGYLKTVDVFLSQVFALFFVNAITYAQLSLMNNWLVPINYFASATLIQILIAGIFTWLGNTVYRKVFPPREILLIHGERDIEDVLRKFETRKDKYKITRCMDIKHDIKELQKEILKGYGAVMLWDIPTMERNLLLKYCYSRFIRVYVMPKIPDVMIKGADQLHLFDTPIFLTREYALTVGQRMAKRMIDLVCALILLVIAAPFMVVTAVVIKCYDGGPVLYKQTRCTRDGKKFQIMKFRSMRVDAEKDGVARLAAKNDSRITPIGKFIRMVRIDELPQLFNILKGDMAFIGPRPERPEIIEQYVEDMPEFVFRMRVKAGLAGYAQVYGKYNTTPYDKLKLDLTYIENYSVWLDLKLMLLTLKILIKPESTEGVDSAQVTAMKALKAEEPWENEDREE